MLDKGRGDLLGTNGEYNYYRADSVLFFWAYIPQFCQPPSKVKFFFDVYDVEEVVL